MIVRTGPNENLWEKLGEGEPRIFGFLQLDIARSSELKGTERNKQKTKANLETLVTNILGNYGGRKLKWSGDGGAFIFLIQKAEIDYDNMVRAATHVLVNIPFFNTMVGTLNLLDQDLRVRISCHKGEANYHRDPGKMHGSTLNYFLKREREIGHENAVTLTEDVYNELASTHLKNLFQPIKPHEYTLAKRPYSKSLYLLRLEELEFLKDDLFLTTALRIRKKATYDGPMGETLLTFANERLRGLEQSIESLSSRDGIEMDKADVIFITQLCFKFGRGKYDGIDSHAPSEFLGVYPEYLTFHAENLQRNPGKENRGSRILITTLDGLRRDLSEKGYEEFLKWHEDHEIPLLVVDPTIAFDLKERFDLPTTDVGIWYQHYALLFEPKEGKTKLWLAYHGDERYKRCVEYFEALHKEARPITTFPELFDKKLADNWKGFIDPEKRLALEGPFLLNILEPYKSGRILDAAAGIGCEYVFLTQSGFNVWANEIEEALRGVGRVYAKGRDIPWFPTKYYWQQFGELFPAYWDAILVLGNSLCLLEEKKDQEECIQQFFRALKPGGMLVIDERNFSYILKDKDTIEKNPITNFRYSQKIMYCQDTIQGAPYGKITEDIVTFVYFPKSIENINEAWNRRIGLLNMYPFKKNELFKLLKKQGFVDIRKYSDFVEGDKDDADFFIYTAIRPKDRSSVLRR